MSDNESIISEAEDIDYQSDAGSESYHASEENYEDEDVTSNKPLNTVRQQSIILPKTNSNLNVKESKIVPVKKTNVKTFDPPSDDEYNEYSTEFDDANHTSIGYSNDFELDGERMTSEKLMTIKDAVYQLQKKSYVDQSKAIPTVIEQQALRLPLVDLASLQAEIALEEISKEVVRMRNQQRNMLQERQLIAKEKKTRAEARRVHYETELNETKQKLLESEQKYLLLTDRSDSIQRSLDATMYSKNILKLDFEQKENESIELRTLLENDQQKLKDLILKFNQEKNNSKVKEEQWVTQKATLQAEVARSNMLASVVQQSLVANEARLTRERERLPQEHQRLLDEQMLRNKSLEGAILEREGSLRAEETRRLAALEIRAREAGEDIARGRVRAEVEFSEERESLRTQKNEAELAKRIFETFVSKEKGTLTASLLDLSRREAALLVEVAAVQRSRMEFEASKQAVEPMLTATAADRDQARRTLQGAEKLLKEAETRATGVLEAERGLLRQEEEIVEREAVAEDIRSKYFNARKLMSKEATKLLATQKELNAQRFRLHGASIELASQAAEVRRTVGLISKHGRLSTAVEVFEPKINGRSIPRTNSDKRRTNSDNDYHSREKDMVHENNNDLKENDGYDSNENHDENTIPNENSEAALTNGEQDQGPTSYSSTLSYRVPATLPVPVAMIGSMSNLDEISTSMQSLAEKLSKPLTNSISDNFSNMYEIEDPNDYIEDNRIPYGKNAEKWNYAPPLRSQSIGIGDIDNEDYSRFDMKSNKTKNDSKKLFNVISSSWPNQESENMSNEPLNINGNWKSRELFNSNSDNNTNNIENFNLRLSIDSAAEYANGLRSAAAKYG